MKTTKKVFVVSSDCCDASVVMHTEENRRGGTIRCLECGELCELKQWRFRDMGTKHVSACCESSYSVHQYANGRELSCNQCGSSCRIKSIKEEEKTMGLTGLTEGIYKHLNTGKLYKYLLSAHFSKEDDLVVVYQSLEDKEVYHRPIAEFSEKFELVYEPVKKEC